MKKIDEQMRAWSNKLISELKIKEETAQKLATTIACDVRWLSREAKTEIKAASPVDIKDRYEELLAFQKWNDIVPKLQKHPAVTRAQVITQNYICFVYLSESCFKVLRNYVSSDSACKKCCNFLISNPVRSFRNAIAHSNWCYKNDFSGLRYWAKKGADPDESLYEFEVNQEDMNFWQAIAKCTAYAAYENLK